MPTLAHVVATTLLLLPAPVVGFVVPMKCLAIGQMVGMHKGRYDQARVLQMGMGLPEEPAANKGGAERATTDTSRGAFLRQQGILAVSAIGVAGVSSPSEAEGLFDFGQDDVIEPVDVPRRMVIGKTQSTKWSNAAPVVGAMRTEAREHFAKAGAKGGREVACYTNVTADGADVTVGLEVSDATGSPALGDGFTASMMTTPGQHLRDDHAAGPGVAAWMTFMTRIPKMGYALKEPFTMFEVYSGAGGKESVAMYAAVKKVDKQ